MPMPGCDPCCSSECTLCEDETPPELQVDISGVITDGDLPYYPPCDDCPDLNGSFIFTWYGSFMDIGSTSMITEFAGRNCVWAYELETPICGGNYLLFVLNYNAPYIYVNIVLAENLPAVLGSFSLLAQHATEASSLDCDFVDYDIEPQHTGLLTTGCNDETYSDATFTVSVPP